MFLFGFFTGLLYDLYCSIGIILELVHADGAEIALSRQILVVIEGIPLAIIFDNRAVAGVAAGGFEVNAFVFPRAKRGVADGIA